jgi:hypothetical protein
MKASRFACKVAGGFAMTTSEFALPENPSPLRYPEWQRPYREALLERDPKRLGERVAEAEAAIFRRLQTLSDGPGGPAERQAIHSAISALKALKRDKLNFPDWESGSRGS